MQRKINHHALRCRITNLALIVFIGASLFLNGILLGSLYNKNLVLTVNEDYTLQMADGRRVKLRGVDMPARDECMSVQAHKLLTELVALKHVRLQNIVMDTAKVYHADVIVQEPGDWKDYMKWYGSDVLGRVAEPDISAGYVNSLIVSKGLGRYRYVDGQYQKVMTQAYLSARNNLAGLHSGYCTHKYPSAACTVKGVTVSGRKLYYPDDCTLYPQVTANRSGTIRWFCGIEQALAEGYSADPVCGAKALIPDNTPQSSVSL